MLSLKYLKVEECDSPYNNANTVLCLCECGLFDLIDICCCLVVVCSPQQSASLETETQNNFRIKTSVIT